MKQTLALTLLLGMALMLGTLPASAQSPQPTAPQPTASQPTAPQMATAEASEKVCLTCHGTDPKVMAIMQSPMAVKGDSRTPFAQGGCVACHGESPDHVALRAKTPAVVFKGPNASPVAVRNQVCLTCHQAGLRMNWQGSQHATNDIACTDCHTVHTAKDPVLVKATQPQTCFTCHAEQRADSFKFSHHRRMARPRPPC